MAEILTGIERDLGQDAAQKLIETYGGQLITIPKKVEGNRIAEDLGPELAEWMVEEYGGLAVDIPIGQKYRKARVRNIVLANPDKSANELARMCDVTSVRIRQIRREERLKAEAELAPT